MLPVWVAPCLVWEVMLILEIRFHGRGGQGAVTAARILAIAANNEGKFSQAFPAFGPERRGAPVQAFTRIDDRPITLRTQIYEPNYVIVLDPSLLTCVDIEEGLKKDGLVLINGTNTCLANVETKHTACFNVTQLALEVLKRPIVNTAMLAMFAKQSGVIKQRSLEDAIMEVYSGKIGEKNVELVKRIWKEME